MKNANRKCPICDNKYVKIMQNIEMVIDAKYSLPSNYDVVCCDNCGFVYADTEATSDDYDIYYSKYNTYSDGADALENNHRIDMMEEILQKYFTKDNLLLDIGSGGGRFEKELLERGFVNITGMDPSVYSIRKLLNNGIEGKVGSIYDVVDKDDFEKYDGVFLFDVAEHLLMPKEGIENALRYVKKGGFFIVGVPNYSIENEMPIPNNFNQEHINYFSEISLNNLLNQVGGKLVFEKRVELLNKANIFEHELIQVYQKTCEKGEINKDLKTEKTVNKYLTKQMGWYDGKNKIIHEYVLTQKPIVIWGTGAYVMSLQGYTELSKCNIVAYIDNNKLKQSEKFLGKKVYSSDFLRKNTQYDVLVCVMTYASDICEQIKAEKIENNIIFI